MRLVLYQIGRRDLLSSNIPNLLRIQRWRRMSAYFTLHQPGFCLAGHYRAPSELHAAELGDGYWVGWESKGHDNGRHKTQHQQSILIKLLPRKTTTKKSKYLPIFRVIYHSLSYPPLSRPLRTQRHIDSSTKQQQQQQTPRREKR